MKKISLIVLVAFTLVLGLAVLARPSQAAYTPVDGDLIKTANDGAVYYIGADSKRHLYVNEVTFWTWYTGSWSEIKSNGIAKNIIVISQADFDNLEMGDNSKVKPGAKLIKFQNSPKIYTSVSYGQLAPVPDDATAKSLFGDNWNTKIITIQSGFETDYTKNGVLVMNGGWKAYQGAVFNIQYPSYLTQDITQEGVRTAVSFQATDSLAFISVASMPNQGGITLDDWANEIVSQASWVKQGSVQITGRTAYILTMSETDAGNRYVFLSEDSATMFDMTIRGFNTEMTNSIINSFILN